MLKQLLYGLIMKDATAITMLAALAQEHRLKIYRLLVQAGPAGVPSSEIATNIGSSPAGTSFHLKELEHAGLVSGTRHGRFILYAINVDAMRELLSFLTEDCCQGQPELCGPATGKSLLAKPPLRKSKPRSPAIACTGKDCADAPAKRRKLKSLSE